MHAYKVIASNPESGIVAVCDDDGRCHVGVAVATTPAPGLRLLGDPPAIGPRALHVADVGTPCPLSLALLNCSVGSALLVAQVIPFPPP